LEAIELISLWHKDRFRNAFRARFGAQANRIIRYVSYAPATIDLLFRTVNQFIHKSNKQASICKRVSAHTLRHSFATHLLERGTDFRYIQTLPGYESSKTTERYTHVTKKGFEKLISPLDYLAKGLNLTTNKGI